MKLNSLWVLEWSHSQQAFHIHTAEEMVVRNLEAFAARRACDYVAIAMSNSRSEIDECAELCARSKNKVDV